MAEVLFGADQSRCNTRGQIPPLRTSVGSPNKGRSRPSPGGVFLSFARFDSLQNGTLDCLRSSEDLEGSQDCNFVSFLVLLCLKTERHEKIRNNTNGRGL